MKKNNGNGVLLTTEQLAKRWGMNAGSVENMRNRNKGPVCIKLGRGNSAPVRYRLTDIEAFEKKWERGKRCK